MNDKEAAQSSHPTSLLQNTSVPHLFIYVWFFYQGKHSKTHRYLTKLLDSFTSSWISIRVSDGVGGLNHLMVALIMQISTDNIQLVSDNDGMVLVKSDLKDHLGPTVVTVSHRQGHLPREQTA